MIWPVFSCGRALAKGGGAYYLGMFLKIQGFPAATTVAAGNFPFVLSLRPLRLGLGVSNKTARGHFYYRARGLSRASRAVSVWPADPVAGVLVALARPAALDRGFSRVGFSQGRGALPLRSVFWLWLPFLLPSLMPWRV